MSDKFGKIVSVLEDLLKEEDVLASVVAISSGGTVSPTADKFKIKNIAFWGMVNNTMNEAFSIFGRFQPYGIDKMYFELGDYEIVFFQIDAKTILVCAIPALANKGLLEVEIENARREIKGILSSSE